MIEDSLGEQSIYCAATGTSEQASLIIGRARNDNDRRNRRFRQPPEGRYDDSYSMNR
ncbi:hypothetical protein HLH34_00130 [Gluconacetobacter azotocaptans]|uniref:Uncharacterized protein n=1 Tax=Gluconacetobacter azotocaptans TaxID=142834 RepID=A0A7W4JPF2_9PROT|nr:hypothetical protein [Gluconacetobacter azotocaptans]MBB2188377.1 hypothetical protein [Gluconacetobacter azotocaptans]MBM9400088.1 hypothetical protein [Gluconacetobacter azotocaptans]